MPPNPEQPVPEQKRAIEDPNFKLLEVRGENLTGNRLLANQVLRARGAYKLWALDQLASIGSFSETEVEFVLTLGESLDRVRKLKRVEDLIESDDPIDRFGEAERFIQSDYQDGLVVLPPEVEAVIKDPMAARVDKLAIYKDLMAKRLSVLSEKYLSRYDIKPSQTRSLDIKNNNQERLVLDVELSTFLHDSKNIIATLNLVSQLAKRSSLQPSQNPTIPAAKEARHLTTIRDKLAELYKSVNEADEILGAIISESESLDVDFKTISQVARQQLTEQSALRGFSFEIQGEDLDLSSDVLIYWPAEEIKRTFQNMISNSEKAFFEKSEKLNLDFKGKIGVSFRVEDTGSERFLIITFADNGFGFTVNEDGDIQSYDTGRTEWLTKTNQQTGEGEGMIGHAKMLNSLNGGTINKNNIQRMSVKPFGFRQGAVNTIRIPFPDEKF